MFALLPITHQMTRFSAILPSLLLVACAATNEIVPIGKDTYIVSGWGKSPGGYSGAEVKAAAIREASKFCISQGRQVQVVSSSQRDMSFGINATAELQFMCLNTSDTDYSRAPVKREADTAIDVRTDTKITADRPTKSIYDELLKLDELRKRGIITEAEFETQKLKLLGKP